MKKTNITILSLFCILSLCFASCASAPNIKEDIMGETIAEEDIINDIAPELGGEDAKGSPVDTVCPEHPDWFHSLDAELEDYAESLKSEEKKSQDPDTYLKIYEQYFNIFVRTEDINPLSFCRYYGISYEEYKNIYERLWNVAENEKDYKFENFTLYYRIDELFGDAEQFNEYFMKDSFKERKIKSERIMPKEDCNHTYTYHTIHYTLIEFVGEEKYNEFKEQFAETEEFNIINFLDYFQIDKDSYLKIMQDAGHTGVLRGKDRAYLHFYHPEYLFGSEEEQELYFVCHPLRKE